MSDTPNPADTATTTTAVANTDSTTAIAPEAGKGQGDVGTTVDDAAVGDKPAGDKPAEHEGAPETYEAFTLPEGLALDGARADFTNALFKDLDLSQTQAQKLLDAMVKLRGETEGELQGDIDAKVELKREALREQWGEQSKTEFAGKFDEIAKDARAGVKWAEQHRPNILKTFDDEGWGNHPDALWTFAKLGELTRGSSMDGLGGETAGGGQPASLESRMYPGMQK